MRVSQLRELLRLVRRMDDRTLSEIATLPRLFMWDYQDRVIVAVAQGEIEWRADV